MLWGKCLVYYVFPIVFIDVSFVFWLWQKSKGIVSRGGTFTTQLNPNCMGGGLIWPNFFLFEKIIHLAAVITLLAQLYSCTAATLGHIFGLLWFSFSLYSCKLCILALAKIQTNCIGRGLIWPNLSCKYYNFFCPFFFFFFCVKGRLHY